MQPITAAHLGRAAAAFGGGLVVGVVGTVMHRAIEPWGLVLSLALVLAATLTARAWAGWFGYAGAVGGTFLSTRVLSATGPGGDVLVPGTDLWGPAWVVGFLVVAAVVALVPRRWVEDERPDGP